MIMKIYFATCAWIVVASLLLFTALSCKKVKPDRISIGALADKDADHSHRQVIITNAGGSKPQGRFMVFESRLDNSYSVVFVLASGVKTLGSESCFFGSCEGVRVSGVPGCPCEPPFVLVTNVEPGSSNSD